jgi:uncharacterized protein Yka (UPF0111/DUF47 family)
VRLSLQPRERRFYALFAEQGRLVRDTLVELQSSLDSGESRHSVLRKLEHECDDITHEIYNLTNVTFVPPMDRADILALAHAVDQIVDLAEELSDRIDLYAVGPMTDAAKRIGKLLADAGALLADLLGRLEDFDGVAEPLERIHSLENEADHVSRHALQQLFDSNGRAAAALIKWKDVYGLLESTIDECETVAEIVERMRIKGT